MRSKEFWLELLDRSKQKERGLILAINEASDLYRDRKRNSYMCRKVDIDQAYSRLNYLQRELKWEQERQKYYQGRFDAVSANRYTRLISSPVI